MKALAMVREAVFEALLMNWPASMAWLRLWAWNGKGMCRFFHIGGLADWQHRTRDSPGH